MAFVDTYSQSIRVDSLELTRDEELSPYADLLRVRDYWDRKRGARFAPRRADVHPADLIEALPRVMLADVLSDPLDFRYRLSGTAINEILSGEQTGKSPRDFSPPAFGAMIFEHYREACLRRRPLFHIVILETRERARTYARMLLPFSEDGNAVTMLMSVHSKEEDTRQLREFFMKAACAGVK
jgi:hypothetical protein